MLLGKDDVQWPLPKFHLEQPANQVLFLICTSATAINHNNMFIRILVWQNLEYIFYYFFFSLWQPKLTFLQRCSRLYLLLYPYFHSSWEFISLLCQLSFMLQGGKWHSIGMFLSGTELKRAPETDEDDDGKYFTESKERYNSCRTAHTKVKS